MRLPTIVAAVTPAEAQEAMRVAAGATGMADGENRWFGVPPSHIPTGLDGMNELAYHILEFSFHPVKRR
jgi:hypothetical protein